MGNCSSEPQVHSSQRRPNSVSKKKSNLGEHPSDEDDSSDSQSELNPYEQERAEKETFNAKLWESIFQEYGHKLVDPQDVHSILDSALSSTIHKLHSAEMTLVLRRVRKVVRSILYSPKSIIENGNSSGNNGHEDKRKNSKAIYQKDHLLDEYLVRQIFIAGDRWISRCEKEHTVTKKLKEYHERKRNDPRLKSIISSDDTKASASNRHDKVPQKEKQQHTDKAADLIGAAYTIMLHLSESRWDYVANIAKVSAENAGLNLDVNHRVLKDDQTLDSSSTQKKINGSSPPHLPSPPPISLTDSNAYDFSNTPVPAKDNGVTIQAISFLIALVLRGSRKQRLVFLFYLLLDPKVLELFLENHPSGGVPSWLLELDQDWALSFAGLGHYLYNENTLKVDVHQAIETICIMLSYGTSSIDFSSNGANSTLSINESNFGNRKRALSYGDAKYHAAKMHIMLADYLHDVRTEKDYPTFENKSEQKWRLEVLDKFWDASYILYSQSNQKYWSLDEFLSWADAALPTESTIDITMHQIFGMGLLPTPAMERKLVADSWTNWQMKEARHLFHLNEYSGFNHDQISAFQDKNALDPNKRSSVWGGIGGFDGRGGLGFGIMYCIDKEWWDHWQRYVRWEWNGEIADISIESRTRPQELSTEKLLDRLPDSSITGSLGSYELMKTNLKKEKDYVLIPPGVWDILYELYGGGPPLPRMITNPYDEPMLPNSTSEVCMTPMKIPQALQVLTHPWVLECHVCDPHQPYRRGEAGHMSIRLMASPDQSLSRLLAEIILRLPIVHPRGKDGEGRGRARLWRETNTDTEDDDRNHSSYGPWALLKDQAAAEFPVGENIVIDKQNYESFLDSWNEYADHGTLESLGISDGIKLMFEYALVGKDGKFTWPREAAEKAGRMLRDNAEDIDFRLFLRGINREGVGLPLASHSIVGTVVDAMDSTGRWFQAEIVEADMKDNHFDDDSSDSTSVEYDSHGFDGECVDDKSPNEIKAVKIDFTEVGGHEEWIPVNSDRLAVKGRFTMDSMKSIDENDLIKQSNGDQRSFGAIILRRRTTKDQTELRPNNNICLFPGFGACGLSNLGNTCYLNSAVQCISYIPLLRAYLISGRFRKHGEVNIDNPLGTGGKLLEELASLEETIWSGKFSVRYPSRFRNQLGRSLSQYSSNDQQDAQEFLNDLLDSLHEDSNKVIKKPYVEALEDKWVDQSDLHQVGEEAWRRYLRRNRSIITNIAMGQVLNRVTCPVCEYTSHNFDPFNMLSIPFPTLSDVVFHCKVLRRATSFNCTRALNAPETSSTVSPILEEYVVSLPRLADIGDLKQKLHDLCGIPLQSMKIYVTNDSSMKKNTGTHDEKKSSFVSLSALPEKEGPCLQYARQNEPGQFLSPLELSTTVVVFESTLKPRQIDIENWDTVKDDDWHSQNIMYQKQMVRNDLEMYGDSSECRLLDTVPTLLAKSISRVLWPKSMDEVVIGLRVDAIDERGYWFPGSIVEISQVGDNTEPSKQKAKVHFDNYSTKWDLCYTFNDITKGKVRPLHSHTHPKDSPLEFLVYNSTELDSSGLFSTPFCLQCFSEWSVARAGAHILAQATRFVKCDENEMQRGLTKTIDILLEYDRLYLNTILSIEDDKSMAVSALKLKCSSLQADLEKMLVPLLSTLPFDVYLCDSINLETDDEDEWVLLNYRLDSSIGNLMNARNGIILHWKKHGRQTLFHDPEPVLHSSTETLRSNDSGMSMHKKKLKYSHGGMPLAVCLDEFCNEQNLSSEDCWRCPRCKEFREGRQSMKLWRLPDILTFHLKRFNCSAKWREKITTKINFPLTGLDMKQWCDKDSAALHSSEDSYVYDLIGVVNHYGGMTGGHYVAFCKATGCSQEGSEEVEHNFTGAGVHAFGAYEEEKGNNSGTWKIGRNKDKDSANAQTKAAHLASKAVAEGSEPLWLQFDDESVEPIPPRCVNSENAYVLFYRKRRISPYNIARYSSME